MSITATDEVVYTIESQDAPDEVKNLISRDAQPSKVKLVIRDGVIHAISRASGEAFPATSEYWTRRKATDGFNFSDPKGSKVESKRYRAALASDTGRTPKSRSVKAKAPTEEIVELPGGRTYTRVIKPEPIAPKGPTKAMLETENQARADLITQLKESLAQAEARAAEAEAKAAQPRQRRNR